MNKAPAMPRYALEKLVKQCWLGCYPAQDERKARIRWLKNKCGSRFFTFLWPDGSRGCIQCYAKGVEVECGSKRGQTTWVMVDKAMQELCAED